MSSETSLTSPGVGADFCIDPADLNVPSPAPAPTGRQIGVLPAVDLANGTISFAVPGGWQSYFFPEPWRIESALQNATRAAQWNPYLEVLTITVASADHRSGEALHFSLTPLAAGSEKGLR